MNHVLEGVRVLDFTHALAGPYCTMLLAQYGADVYKLEAQEGGDMGRGWAPPFTGDQASYFLALNAGKKGICVDIKKPEGIELCLALIEKMDVLIENFRPGTMDRLGLGYAIAKQRNPRLIYCSISGYGQTGPARDEPAMDLVVQASSGFMSITGNTEGQHVRSGHSVADTTAGLFGVIGILMALQARNQTGAGQFVDISMQDGMVSTMCSSFANYCGTGKVPRPMGTSFASIVPYRTFPTADREIAIAVGSEKLWHSFCQVIGAPYLDTHKEYATNALRVKNRAKLEDMLIDIFRRKPAAEWVRRFGEVGIPCSLVRNIDEVFASPQMAARGMFPKLEHATAGMFPVTGPPVKLSETPGSVTSAAPRLGEHTRAVLAELLDLDAGEVEKLAAEGIISASSRATHR